MVVQRYWRALCPLSLVTIALLTLAAPAHAQFGVLKRAAERRVGEKAQDRLGENNLIAPTFDATTIAITAERLDRFSAAMVKKAEGAKRARAASEELKRRADITSDSAKQASPDKEREAYDASTKRYKECRNGVADELNAGVQQRFMEMQAQALANPSAYQKDPKTKAIADAMKEMAAAQARGDNASFESLTAKVMGLMGVIVDSAAIDGKAVPKCGQRPMPSRSMLTAAAMRERASALNKQADDQLRGAMHVNAADVGMTQVQANMFCERVGSFMYGMRADAPITITFSKEEYHLLIDRRSDLRKLSWDEC